MKDEVITISKRHLQDLEEKVAKSRISFALHSSRAIERAKENFDKQIQNLKLENEGLNQTNIKLLEINAALKAKNDNLELQQNYMYQRLRERANADRNIPGKKTNHGYVLESSRQVEEQYRDRYDVPHINKIWKTTIQTPFIADLHFDTVKDAVIKDITSDQLSHDFGYIYHPAENATEAAETAGNAVLYKIQYVYDRKRGYWYIEVWTTGYITPAGH